MRPSLETLAGLYHAAKLQQQAAELALRRVENCALKHGYAVAAVVKTAYPAPAKELKLE